MTQGMDGISLAHARALKLMRLARRLSLVAAMVAVAALVAGTPGTSYARKKPRVRIVIPRGCDAASKTNTPKADRLKDTVVVSNYGAVFDGSIETFLAGVGHNAGPKFWIKGPNTFLSSSTGAGGDAVSSNDHAIAVAIPIDFFDLTGCGPFGLPASAPAYGTGLAEIFSPTANGNSAPENIICSPYFAYGYPNTTGIFYPQGVAFESPYDGVNPGTDILAVANMFPEVTQDTEICVPLGLPASTLGTITMYDRSTLLPYPAYSDVAPFNNTPVAAINPFTGADFTQSATLGGCATLMAGPTGLTFDQAGNLFVVNNAGFDAPALAALPRFVTVYAPPFYNIFGGFYGDVFPTSLLGLYGATAGAFLQPVADTVDADENLYVTDTGDNSIKIFEPFVNYDEATLFFDGEQTGEIKGGHTKLKIPEGIALSPDGDALYVVNNTANSLEMFTDFGPEGEQDIPPTLIVQGPHAKMNLPVGVALPAFTPTP